MKKVMNVAKSLRFVALALALSVPGLAEAKDGEDSILLVDGRTVRGVKVSDETFAEVKYRDPRRGTTTVEGSKVREITHGEAPRAYKAGDGQRRGGQYNKAVNSYKAALKSPKAKGWVKVYANYYIGECLRLSGKADQAMSYYKKAAKDTKHLLYPRVMIGIGQAHGDQRSWSDAISTLKKVSEGRFGLWRAKADYELGRVLAAKGDMSEARRAFARVQGQRDDPSMRMAGTVGEGETYMLEKNFRKARDFFKRILGRSRIPREVAAGAWAGIGDCELAMGKKGDKEADRRALLAYLRVVVQFAGTPGAYPKALFEAANLYEKFGKKDQATSLRSELRSRCPTSKYTSQLKDG